MKRRVIVVGHADADGHLITEQTRRNLSRAEHLDVRALINPQVTKDHRAWLKLDQLPEIDQADLIFFVDMMFGPSDFAQEAASLVSFAQNRPDKIFFVIDHHPLPLRRLEQADNLHCIYRPDVFNCAIGPRSGMMIVAALCENQTSTVSDVSTLQHEALARGLRRAAAAGSDLAGIRLLALLRADCWTDLAELGKEDKELHRMPRGRRSGKAPPSKALEHLRRKSEELLARNSNSITAGHSWERSVMPYDFDVGQERFETNPRPYAASNRDIQTKDLEVIVTLLEVAALSLTNDPGDTFTYTELWQQAKELCGEDTQLDERDVQVVLEKANFLERVHGRLRLR